MERLRRMTDDEYYAYALEAARVDELKKVDREAERSRMGAKGGDTYRL